MNFLALCRAAELKSALVSSQQLLTTTINQVGRHLKFVTAVADSWTDIQRSRPDWGWMRGTFTQALTIGQGSYTPANLGIASRFRAFLKDTCDFSPHTIYDTTIGQADESPLYQISPEQWRSMYDRGVQTRTRPCHYALDNGNLLLGPIPDKAYTVRGWYMKAPQVLAADADTPECPDFFHDIIKWRAILDMHGQDGAFADRSVAQAEYSRLYRQLCNEHTAPVVLGGSLD
jgi:hypothetical protein